MKTIIPCAGYATRLYPLTENQPKALLPVNEKPIIEHVLESVFPISKEDDIYIVTNDKFAQNFEAWKTTTPFLEGKRNHIHIINDETTSNEDRLGTIGDLWKAMSDEDINEDLLVIMGDNLFDFNLKEAEEQFNQTTKSLILAYDVKSIDEAKKMGNLQINEQGQVTHFIEKPAHPPTTLTSVGIYFFKKEHLPTIKEYVLDEGLSNDRMGDLIAYMVEQQQINATTLPGTWYDIGSLDTYQQANNKWQA